MSYQVLDLFPIPVYKSTLPALDPITVRKLQSHEWEHEEGFVTHTETDERHLLDLPAYKGLKKEIQKHINTYVYDIIGAQKDHQWEITTSWVNRSRPGQYHTMHWHSNSMVSGVMYVNATPTTGAILFHKDRGHTNLWSDTLRLEYDKETDYNTEAVGIQPKTNEILLFPSILNHSVMENTSNEDRFSLAFNVFPKGTFGEGGNSELKL